MDLDGLFELGAPGEIGPFIGIISVVVEFLGAIGVDDIPEVLGTHRVVVLAKGGEGWEFPGGVGFVEQRNEAMAFEAGTLGEAAELDEGGIEIDETDWAVTLSIPADAGSCDEQWDPCRDLPQGAFTPALLGP